MLFRTPDYLNVALAAMAAARDFFAASEARYGDNIANYYLEARKHDWCATLTSIGPGTTFHKANEGIVVKGTGASAPLAPFAEELLVFPSTPLNVEHAAIVFAIPSNTKGVRFIFRDEDYPRADAARSHFDAPLASRFDTMDGPVIFDDVIVPWSRVFLCGDLVRCNALFNETSARLHMTHQEVVKIVAKAEFMLGIAARIAEMSDVTGGPHFPSRVWIAQMIDATEQMRACLRTAETDATSDKWGIMTPARAPLFAARALLVSVYPALMQIMQLIGGVDFTAPPSEPEPTDLAERERAALRRLAWDATGSAFARNQLEFERALLGDSTRMANDSLGATDLTPLTRRIKDFLARTD
jgi:4-hydroxyphenylacetate 3-monooxygenase